MSKRLTALLLAFVVTAVLFLVPVCAEGDDSSAAESTTSVVSSESDTQSSADESKDASADTSSDTSADTSSDTSADTSVSTLSDVSGDKNESKGSFPWGPVIFLALVVIFVVVCVICVKSKNRFGLWLSKQLRDYKSEVSKISWLGPNELVKQTGVAIAILVAAGIGLGVLDWVFNKLFELLVNLF